MNNIDEKKAKAEIIDFMKSFCVGGKNAQTRASIEAALNIEDRHFRELVSEIVAEQKVPIVGSSSTGSFIIETNREFDEIYGDLIQRGRQCLKRASHLKVAFQRSAGQEEIFEPGQFKTLGQRRIKEIIEQNNA